MLRKIILWAIRRFYKKIIKLINKLSTYYFIASTNAGEVKSVKHPCHVLGGDFIIISDGFQSGPGLRLEAISKYNDIQFKPKVLIGRNVSFGSNCHLGAINHIEIHDNVMIGSNVLITDHQHGNLQKNELDIHAVDRPLYSKGPVVIEKNVWIGENAVIMPGVRIGCNAVIGASTVVTKNVPSNTIFAGVPARLIKQL